MTQRAQQAAPRQAPANAFGLHLTLDGYGGSQERLANLDLIYEFLEHCPDLIHMTKIMPPYVFKYHAKVPEDWGVSGFVLIAESHISIHTFPERGLEFPKNPRTVERFMRQERQDMGAGQCQVM